MSSVCVGNDIVDLTNPRTERRSADERFVARVLDPDEQRTVQTSTEPDLELWCLWAAKEAGFKAISKLVGEPPPFVHRAFKVSWRDIEDRPAGSAGDDALDLEGPHSAGVIRQGTVTWHDHCAPVVVARRPEGIHAISFTRREEAREPARLRPCVALLDEPESPWSGSLEELLPRFTEREADAVYSVSSAAVRVGARRELARLLGVEERRLEIVCAPGPTSQRPPRVLLDGAETEADVSLSHDGPLIAWALWVSRDRLEPTLDREDTE